MSQNPYAQHDLQDRGGRDRGGREPGGRAAFEAEYMPPKTSALAVAGLVLAVPCCLPGLAQLGALLGVAGIFRIGLSGGRLRGMGMAVAAVVLGLIGTTMWLGGAAALSAGVAEVTRLEAVVRELEAGDVPAVRTRLTPELSAAVTDGELLAWQSAVAAEWGVAQESKPGLLAYGGRWSKAWAVASRAVQGMQPPSGGAPGQELAPVPLPMTFSNGSTVVFVVMDARSGDVGTVVFSNLGAVMRDGSVLWLVDPAGADAPATDGAATDAPAGDGAGGPAGDGPGDGASDGATDVPRDESGDGAGGNG